MSTYILSKLVKEKYAMLESESDNESESGVNKESEIDDDRESGADNESESDDESESSKVDREFNNGFDGGD